MSEYTNISFIEIYSLQQFLQEARSIRETETLVFHMKQGMEISEENIENVAEIANHLRETNSIVILIIDCIIDCSLLDCLLSADICFATTNGKCNSSSKYIPTGLYSVEQIKYMLAIDSDDIFVNDIDNTGKFLSGSLITEKIKDVQTEVQLIDYVKAYIESLIVGKKDIQIKRIKEYFNSFKSAEWNQREKIMNFESRQFCFLAHQVGEV